MEESVSDLNNLAIMKVKQNKQFYNSTQPYTYTICSIRTGWPERFSSLSTAKPIFCIFKVKVA